VTFIQVVIRCPVTELEPAIESHNNVTWLGTTDPCVVHRRARPTSIRDSRSQLAMGKPLPLELEGLWTARRGQYRVLYRIDQERRVVEIVTIDHRGGVYRRARRG